MRDEPAANKAFPKTSWTAIAAAGGVGNEAAQRAVANLLKRYLPALRAYLLHQRRFSADQADDLLQGFVTTRILEHHLIAHADPQRGRFRNLLLGSLNHYIANQSRDERRAKRYPGSGRLMALDEAPPIPSDAAQPSDVFDVAWAQEAIGEALRRMESACRDRNRLELWSLFRARVVLPAIEGAEPVPYQELVRQYAFHTPAQATNALVTAKRMFVRLLREVIAEYAQSEAEVEEELVHLKACLAKARKFCPLSG